MLINYPLDILTIVFILREVQSKKTKKGQKRTKKYINSYKIIKKLIILRYIFTL